MRQLSRMVKKNRLVDKEFLDGMALITDAQRRIEKLKAQRKAAGEGVARSFINTANRSTG
jgi:hypothetical protein